MSRCPYCTASADPLVGNAGTCGSFACLYRHFRGTSPPTAVATHTPPPWTDPNAVRRIAVFRPGQLGDLLLAVPGLRALRAAFPAAEIALVAGSWTLDFPSRFGYIDRVLPLDDPPAPNDDARLDGANTPFLAEARASDYDLVLQLHGDTPSAARLALAMGGRATVGFCRDEQIGGRFHLLLPWLPDEPEILRVLRLADALGATPDGVQLEFPPLPTDWEELEAISGLSAALPRRPLVVMHPGARAPARRWPLEGFAKVARHLQQERGATLVMVGGSEERWLVEEVIQGLAAPALNLTGKLSLGALAALLRRADLFVGNDSGPAQLASAVAPRGLRIFGPANRRRWAPLDRCRHRIVYHPVDCSPCDHWECPIDHRCLRRVSVEEVLAQVDTLLEEASPPDPYGTRRTEGSG